MTKAEKNVVPKKAFCILTQLMLALTAFSAAGNGLQYQARMTNPDTGAPREGTFTMTFRLYDVDTGGAALWTEIRDITVENGLFTTLLGDITPIPETIFNGQALWIGVKVGADAEAEPRQQLAPVAYAFHAANAQQLDGIAPAEYAQVADVFTIVSSAAGSGSGLNADLLDGLDSTDFAGASHNHDAVYVKRTGPDMMTGTSNNPILQVTQSGSGTAGEFVGASNHGILGITDSTTHAIAGVLGRAGIAPINITGKHGVRGESESGRGVVGVSDTSSGVFGWSNSASAIQGETLSADAVAVRGINFAPTGGAVGVFGTSHSSGGFGVRGTTSSSSGSTYGVFGRSDSSSHGAGVRGEGNYVGLWGTTASSTTPLTWGVYGSAGFDGYSIFGVGPGGGGWAGYFTGRVNVTGALTKGSGSFKIDHPLEPEEKYLYHSFVESPDMMNIYNGTVELNAEGRASVELPTYFDALNRDFRYQLTAIGAPAPNLHIASEVLENRFEIAGGSPGLKVSWLVTGIRKDPFAETNRIPVEEEKPDSERGTYIHPEAYGVVPEKALALKLGPESAK